MSDSLQDDPYLYLQNPQIIILSVFSSPDHFPVSTKAKTAVATPINTRACPQSNREFITGTESRRTGRPSSTSSRDKPLEMYEKRGIRKAIINNTSLIQPYSPMNTLDQAGQTVIKSSRDERRLASAHGPDTGAGAVQKSAAFLPLQALAGRDEIGMGTGHGQVIEIDDDDKDELGMSEGEPLPPFMSAVEKFAKEKAKVIIKDQMDQLSSAAEETPTSSKAFSSFATSMIHRVSSTVSKLIPKLPYADSKRIVQTDSELESSGPEPSDPEDEAFQPPSGKKNKKTIDNILYPEEEPDRFKPMVIKCYPTRCLVFGTGDCTIVDFRHDKYQAYSPISFKFNGKYGIEVGLKDQFESLNLQGFYYGLLNLPDVEEPFGCVDFFMNGPSPFPSCWDLLRLHELGSTERMSNFRVLLDIRGEKDDFLLACKRLNFDKYEIIGTCNYLASRPFRDADLRMNGDIPFAASRSGKQLRNGRTYASTPTPSRKSQRTLTTSSSRTKSDDGDCLVVQPAIPSRGELMFIFPEDSPDGIHMTTVELARLQPGIYLNDNIIDWDIKRMWSLLPDPDRSSIFTFNSFFYKRYSAPREKPGPSQSQGQGQSTSSPYERVRSWTNGVDLFEKSMLVIPINEALHWYLAVIMNPGKLIEKAELVAAANATVTANGTATNDDFDGDGLVVEEVIEFDEDSCYIAILDSLFSSRTGTIEKLKQYLIQEAHSKRSIRIDKKWMKGLHVKCPKQDNLTDCGCYLLQNVDEIFRSLPTIKAGLFHNNHPWYQVDRAKARRLQLSRLMRECQEEYRTRHLLPVGQKHPQDLVVDVDGEPASSDIEEITVTEFKSNK